jgi:hypothetical protein
MFVDITLTALQLIGGLIVLFWVGLAAIVLGAAIINHFDF